MVGLDLNQSLQNEETLVSGKCGEFHIASKYILAYDLILPLGEASVASSDFTDSIRLFDFMCLNQYWPRLRRRANYSGSARWVTKTEILL